MEENKERIPEFTDLLEKSKAIHLKKNQDYASESNPFSNFERSAILQSWFNDPVDKSFVNLIGTKLARLTELRNGNRTPKNESIYDTILDLGTYCFLWGSYIIRGDKNKIKMCHLCGHQMLIHNFMSTGKCAFCECKEKENASKP